MTRNDTPSLRSLFSDSLLVGNQWLSVVGIGADGLASLNASARAALDGAEVLVGGKRHLDMIPADSRERLAWPSPFNTLTAELNARRSRNVCVLATGDPMWYGVGVALAKAFGEDDMCIYPAPGCISLACAKLRWAIAEVDVVSLHGRPVAGLVRALSPGAKALVIPHDGGTLGDVLTMLCERGLGQTKVTLLEQLGGDPERCVVGRAEEFSVGESIDPFSVIAIEVTAGDAPEVYSLSPGLPDQAFKHDGQLTKRIVRAATLSALAPFPGEMLWDVGAGCGSISIEWMRAARGTHAIAVESDAKRRELIDFNAQRLGVPQLRIEAGRAPETLTNLPAPQAIFIGGGASDPAIFERCWDAMMGGGRLVVNAVTLEGEQQLNMRHNELGGELNRISVESPSAQGRFRMMQPARTVTQLALVKQR